MRHNEVVAENFKQKTEQSSIPNGWNFPRRLNYYETLLPGSFFKWAKLSKLSIFLLRSFFQLVISFMISTSWFCDSSLDIANKTLFIKFITSPESISYFILKRTKKYRNLSEEFTKLDFTRSRSLHFHQIYVFPLVSPNNFQTIFKARNFQDPFANCRAISTDCRRCNSEINSKLSACSFYGERNVKTFIISH